MIRAAEQTAELGASEFCIVLAVRGPDARLLDHICSLVPLISERTGLNVAVSAGILAPEQARELAQAGVHRYNHNLETARSFFGQVVTTHTWEERAETCRLVVENGMELCCGALLGMGESDAQRVELITQLRQSWAGRGAAQLLEPAARNPARRPDRSSTPGTPSDGSRCSASACLASSCGTREAARSPFATYRRWASPLGSTL